jgi:hypothetical protein
MRISKKEREFLTLFVGSVQKLLEKNKIGKVSSQAKRTRRSSSDTKKLRKQVAAARRKKVSVKQIAKELGVTTSYIYQLGR